MRSAPRTGRALFLLGPDNPLRVAVHGVVTSVAFEAAIIAAIALNIVVMVLQTPGGSRGAFDVLAGNPASLQEWLTVIDFAFLILFTLEAVLRVVAFGFLFTPTAYLRADAWNRLDFLALVTSWLTMVPGSPFPRFAA
ncbi:MAG: ion transporter, partial [Hydrogenophaga sp.]